MDPKYIIFFCGLINICLGQQNGRVSKETKYIQCFRSKSLIYVEGFVNKQQNIANKDRNKLHLPMTHQHFHCISWILIFCFSYSFEKLLMSPFLLLCLLQKRPLRVCKIVTTDAVNCWDNSHIFFILLLTYSGLKWGYSVDAPAALPRTSPYLLTFFGIILEQSR